MTKWLFNDYLVNDMCENVSNVAIQWLLFSSIIVSCQ
jgi:hypothetical protein